MKLSTASRMGIVIVLALGAVAAPGGADAQTKTVYFTCNDSAAANASSEFGWSDDEPRHSIAEGQGCAFADVQGDPWLGREEIAGVPISPRFSGSTAGSIDTVTVRLWNADATHERLPAVESPGVSILVWLSIDGVESLDGQEVILTPRAAQPGPRLFQFSVTDLGFTGPDHDGDHHVELRVQTMSRSEASLWLFGAQETPSGLDFNPADLADARVPAVATPPSF